MKLIEQTRGEKLDIEMIPIDDPETFKKVFHTALTSGVFQFESRGMRDILRRYKPDTVEELTALNALYRPGPMDMIDDFIERKWGRRKVEYLLPALEGILKDSLGVIVYQEQVMRIAQRAGELLAWARRICCGARWGRRMPQAMAEAARPLSDRRGGAGTSEGRGGRDLRPDGEVLRVRIQQVALGGVCAGWPTRRRI